MADAAPRTAAGQAVWYGPDMAGRTDWLHGLDTGHLAELEAAAGALLDASRDIAGVKAEDATLPTIDPLLASIADEVVRGRGFVLLRGLPVERWDRATSALAYWIIGTRLGVAVAQNAQGHVLGHVRDLGHDPTNPMTRYITNARQEYHTEFLRHRRSALSPPGKIRRRERNHEFDHGVERDRGTTARPRAHPHRTLHRRPQGRGAAGQAGDLLASRLS